MRHIIPISGKDSLSAAIVQTTRFPQHDYEFFFNDTGCELPETYAWLSEVERKTGWEIHRIGKSLEAIIHGYGGYLPSSRARYCTRESKIEPMEGWLSGPCTVYYGLRSDENRTGYVPFGDSQITPCYPLHPDSTGWTGLDLQGVWSLLAARDLLPPSFRWQRLADAVAQRLSGIVWEHSLTAIEQHTLFSWRTRGNCFLCFYQRQYELLGLMEHHPELYWRMSAFERPADEKPSAKRQRKEPPHQQGVLLTVETPAEPTLYTWRDGYSLTELANNEGMQNRIFERRVKDVCDYIIAKLQGEALGLVTDTEIARRSCGLLCGK